MVDQKGVLLYTIINSPTWWEWQVQDYSPFYCFGLWHWIQRGKGQRDIPHWVMINRTQGCPKHTFSGNISADGLREVPGTPVVSWGDVCWTTPSKLTGKPTSRKSNASWSALSPHQVNIDGWLDRNSTPLEVRQTRAFDNWIELNILLHIRAISHGGPGTGTELNGLGVQGRHRHTNCLAAYHTDTAPLTFCHLTTCLAVIWVLCSNL